MRISKRIRAFMLIFLILIPGSSCSQSVNTSDDVVETAADIEPIPTTKPTTVKHELTIDGEDRFYLVHTPADLDTTDPVPVVIILHGWSQRPSDMIIDTGFNKVSDQEGFIAVYPDLEFDFGLSPFLEIYSNIESVLNNDPNRTYLVGFSYGGYLAYDVACEYPDLFPAIGAVAPKTISCTSYESDNPVSVIHIHGLADKHAVYDGPPSVDEMISFWADVNGCPASHQEEIDDLITHTIFSPCKDGAAVELYRIDGLPHIWPEEELPSTQLIWEFFEAHPR